MGRTNAGGSAEALLGLWATATVSTTDVLYSSCCTPVASRWGEWGCWIQSGKGRGIMYFGNMGMERMLQALLSGVPVRMKRAISR